MKNELEATPEPHWEEQERHVKWREYEKRRDELPASLSTTDYGREIRRIWIVLGLGKPT